jgi:hypothetical protein
MKNLRLLQLASLATLAGAGATLAGISSDDRDTNCRVFAGDPFHRVLGIELGLLRLGSFSDATSTSWSRCPCANAGSRGRSVRAQPPQR